MNKKAILFLIMVLTVSSYGCTHFSAGLFRPMGMRASYYRSNIHVIDSDVTGERNSRGLVVTDTIRYRVNAGRFDRTCLISERKYLVDRAGRITGEVNRSVEKTSGEYRSVYSFVMPDSYLLQMRYELVTEFKGCGESFVRVINKFTPAQLLGIRL